MSEPLVQFYGGIPIEVSAELIGSKFAAMYRRTLHVSPAMHSLMKRSTPRELEGLLKGLRYVEIEDADGELEFRDAYRLYCLTRGGARV